MIDFFWKHTIYYHIWAFFSENIQFTIVFEHLFLKIINLLSYLSIFFWKLSIYYRIWVVFSENLQFTIVFEQSFPFSANCPWSKICFFLISVFRRPTTGVFLRFFGFPRGGDSRFLNRIHVFMVLNIITKKRGYTHIDFVYPLIFQGYEQSIRLFIARVVFT